MLNVINGEPHAMGKALMDDPRCRKIAFTGSTRVGKLLMDAASRTVKRLALELGGNAPVIVFPDVDVVAVARAGVTAKLRNCGQVCIAPQRFIVHASIAEAFATAAAEAMGREVAGHGLEASTTVGPLINARNATASRRSSAARSRRGRCQSSAARRCQARASSTPPPCSTTCPRRARRSRRRSSAR